MKLSVRMMAALACAACLLPALAPRANAASSSEDSAAEASTVDSGSHPASAAPLVDAPGPGTLMADAQPEVRGWGHPRIPRVELFLGYSYVRAVPTLAEGNRLVWLNGGSASVAFNFNRYVGIVGDFGGFSDAQLRLSTASPATVANSSGTLFTYLVGPRLSYRGPGRLTPYVQALFGGAYASDVTLSACTQGACTLLPSENKFALTAGGGLDLRVRHSFAIRLVQAEYLMTRFADFNTGKGASQNDLRLSSGIVFRFGGGPRMAPAPPLSYSCSVSPATAYSGDPVTVTGSGFHGNLAKTTTYTWSADGGTVSGASETAHIDTANLAPGSYSVKGHISEGNKPEENAECTAAYTIQANPPPTLTCSADSSTITVGGFSTITATGVSPQNRTLTYRFESSAGSISGAGSMATLSAAEVPAGELTVICRVTDDKGQTASASTLVMVVAPAAAPKPIVTQLCSVPFNRSVGQPARVNNEGKACLDDVAISMQRNSDANLALVGSVATGEKRGSKLSAERASNAKAYLENEKGIDATRLKLYTGSKDEATVTTILIPPDANFDTTNDMPVKEK